MSVCQPAIHMHGCGNGRHVTFIDVVPSENWYPASHMTSTLQ